MQVYAWVHMVAWLHAQYIEYVTIGTVAWVQGTVKGTGAAEHDLAMTWHQLIPTILVAKISSYEFRNV